MTRTCHRLRKTLLTRGLAWRRSTKPSAMPLAAVHSFSTALWQCVRIGLKGAKLACDGHEGSVPVAIQCSSLAQPAAGFAKMFVLPLSFQTAA